MVEPLPIRHEKPPEDAIVVIRASVMDSTSLASDAVLRRPDSQPRPADLAVA